MFREQTDISVHGLQIRRAVDFGALEAKSVSREASKVRATTNCNIGQSSIERLAKTVNGGFPFFFGVDAKRITVF